MKLCANMGLCFVAERIHEVTRRCLNTTEVDEYLGLPEQECFIMNHENGHKEECYCSKDLCNSSDTHVIQLNVMVISLLVGLLVNQL